MKKNFLSTPLVIATMAFAIVAFLFLIDTAINPDGAYQTSKSANDTINTNKNSDPETTPEYVIPITDWKTYSDTQTGLAIRYPQDWNAKSCDDAMLVYFAPNDFECGAGLEAIGIQRVLSDQTVSSTIATRKAQLTQTTILDLTVAGISAQRIIGFETETATGRESSRQNDDIYFRQDDYLWSVTSTLQDDGRIFLRMVETLTLTKSVVGDPTAGWKTYTNRAENFSMKYPQTFNDFALSNDNTIGFRGKKIGTATSTESSISLFILEKKYDPANIEGLYGPVEKERQKIAQVGSRPGVMFLSGDAGCGAQEVLTSLDANRTLWISFQDCESATPHTPLYQQQDLVNDILNTFVFTN